MSLRTSFWNTRRCKLIAVAIIVITIIAIFSVGIAVLSFQPAVKNLAYESSFWNSTSTIENPDIIFFRDAMYNASLAIPIFMLAIIAIWAFLSANRRAEF